MCEYTIENPSDNPIVSSCDFDIRDQQRNRSLVVDYPVIDVTEETWTQLPGGWTKFFIRDSAPMHDFLRFNDWTDSCARRQHLDELLPQQTILGSRA
jgi:hypothetical protein